MSHESYSEEFYPGYCSGTGYLLGNGATRMLFENLLPMNWYAKNISEDVLFTGIIRQNAGLKLSNNEKFFWSPAGNCDPNDTAITRHGFSGSNKLYDAWKKCA